MKLNYLDLNGIYNVGTKRFSVTGLYDEYGNKFIWAYSEIDEHGNVLGYEKGINGQFGTDKVPFMSEIFNELMRAVKNG